MAGMLAGVETARMRRIHQSSVWSTTSASISISSRRSTSSHNNNCNSLVRSRMRRCNEYEYDEEENQKLGELARKAKGRLDEKLRNKDRSRCNSNINNKNIKRGALMGLGWTKLMRWRQQGGNEQTETERDSECPVCLDVLGHGSNVVKLECAHSFHSQCLLPWLQTHAHCPCCRHQLQPLFLF